MKYLQQWYPVQLKRSLYIMQSSETFSPMLDAMLAFVDSLVLVCGNLELSRRIRLNPSLSSPLQINVIKPICLTPRENSAPFGFFCILSPASNRVSTSRSRQWWNLGQFRTLQPTT